MSLRIFITAALALAALISPGARAQNPMIAFEDYTLANGLRVVLHRDASTPIVCINICYHVGSKNELPGKTGFAHLFEHLMFDGSENVKRGDFDRYCERAGGYNNAYTNEDKTNYYMLLPANQLELGLWLESDRLHKLEITEFGLKTQREVVKEEKRQRVDNQPYGTTDTKFAELCYSVHPYNHPVIGSMEDISSATMEDVVGFHEMYYTPNNAVLVVTGDIDLAGAKTLVEKYFGGISKGDAAPRTNLAEPPRTSQVRQTVEDNVPLPGVFVAFNSCAEKDPDAYAVDLLTDVLGSGESSRLYHALVYEKKIASQVAVYFDAREHPGLVVVYAIASPGTAPSALEEAMNAEIGKLKEQKIGNRELQKVKNKTEAGLYRSLQTVQNKADRLAHYATFYGKPDMINTVVDRYLAVSSEDIQRAARQYLDFDRSVVLHYVPRTGQK